MLSFGGSHTQYIFDITSPEDDVLINLLSRGGRPICGTVPKFPHFGKRHGGIVPVDGVEDASCSGSVPWR